MSQLGRYEESALCTGTVLPNEWNEALVKELSEVYKDQAIQDNSFFDVYGEFFTKELTLVISYLDHANLTAAPHTLKISAETNLDDPKLKNILSSVIKLASSILDDTFSGSQIIWETTDWIHNPFDGQNLYYQLSRENLSLSIQAEKILQSEIEIKD